MKPLDPSHSINTESKHILSIYSIARVALSSGSLTSGFAMKDARSKAESKKTDSKLKSKSAAAPKRGKKTAKDPNMPKRPASAFFVFMEDFRKQYKVEFPNNKAVSAVGKAGGQKWKSMSDAEKAPYVEKAEKRKTEYTKNMQAYNLKLDNGGDEDESDKSKSEVNDEEDVEAGSGEEEDDE